MKWILWAALAVGLVGCEQTQTQSTGNCGAEPIVNIDPPLIVAPDGGFDGMGGAGGNGIPAVDPCAPYTDSILPAMGMGDVHAICSACNDTCEPLGDACGAYGAPCSFDGGAGVCVSCCSFAVGELRCSKL